MVLLMVTIHCELLVWYYDGIFFYFENLLLMGFHSCQPSHQSISPFPVPAACGHCQPSMGQGCCRRWSGFSNTTTLLTNVAFTRDPGLNLKDSLWPTESNVGFRKTLEQSLLSENPVGFWELWTRGVVFKTDLKVAQSKNRDGWSFTALQPHWLSSGVCTSCSKPFICFW